MKLMLRMQIGTSYVDQAQSIHLSRSVVAMIWPLYSNSTRLSFKEATTLFQSKKNMFIFFLLGIKFTLKINAIWISNHAALPLSCERPAYKAALESE